LFKNNWKQLNKLLDSLSQRNGTMFLISKETRQLGAFLSDEKYFSTHKTFLSLWKLLSPARTKHILCVWWMDSNFYIVQTECDMMKLSYVIAIANLKIFSKIFPHPFFIMCRRIMSKTSMFSLSWELRRWWWWM
jgi:hypothetical protein